ncbi:Mu transposase domain-containing protein [Desulfofarcimen acetoxidans]|uniref:Mu transposase domain-containing protein n=1 Tax=Desulfofarcimen acetoxidans TaxID=58138 RepID=UPI001F618610|nr:hypothetical protein [Desulfofarcimen acetoxidans]
MQLNYHIAIDYQNYSIPYEYIKKKVDVRYTKNMIEVFYKEVPVFAAISTFTGDVGSIPR